MLNAPQQKAVEHPGGPLLVFAGAGSGKTRVLTYRIAHLVTNSGIDPARILAVTFTNKAAREMLDRLERLIGPDACRVIWLGTFHATGARLVRALAEHVNRKPDFSIYDEHDQLTVVKQAMDELFVDKKTWKASELADKIQKHKERGFGPEDVPAIDPESEVFRKVYRRYESWLEAANALDFEDLLLLPMRLAESDGPAGERLRGRFDHVLVDEFQDTSLTQWRFVKAMSKRTGNLTAVGDDDQCHPPGTRIQVASVSRWTVSGNKTTRTLDEVVIESIRTGDRVVGYDRNDYRGAEERAVAVGERHYRGEMLRIWVGERMVNVTPDHRMLCRRQPPNEIHAMPLLIETATRLAELHETEPFGVLVPVRARATERFATSEWEPVRHIERFPYEGTVYSLGVETDEAYFANGIAVHNCLYSWRSADPSIIRKTFARDFPAVTIVKLEQNYRSTANVVRAALGVIEKSESRVDKKLWTAEPAGDTVRLLEHATDRDEGRFIAGEVASLETAGVDLSTVAVLYRTHQVARAIEEPLRDKGVPYVIFGGPRYYDRKEIRDVLAYLRLAQNPASNVDFLRAVAVPPRGIGSAKLARLADLARLGTGKSFFATVPVLLDAGELRPKEREALAYFHEMLRAAHAMRASKHRPSKIAERLLDESGYLRMWKEQAAESKALKNYADELDAVTRHDNAEEILSAIASYEEDAGPRASLDGYLERVALMTEAQKGDGKSVSLMTIHGSKGLEFEHVFVAGCEEGTLPVGRTGDDPVELDEERRLAYVAITRARKHLTMTYAAERFVRGKVEVLRVSRFLRAIPKDVSRDWA